MTKLSAKQKMLNYLNKKEGYNTFSVAQGRRLFGVQNIAARIEELRQEGYCIYTNRVTKNDGTKTSVYKIGKPSRKLVQAAIRGGFNFSV
jgi:biotin operon repressor